MYTQTLDGDWQVGSENQEWIRAKAPGNVHVDLMAAGLIPDCFYGDNELRVQWVAETDWIYRRTFQADPGLLEHDRIFLACDGLDTLATIRLNGTEVARTENMFRRYHFDITGLVRSGGNTIEVKFDSPVAYVRSKDVDDTVISPGDSIKGSPYLRKALCQFGWDWAPKIPTSGIWRSIRLVGQSSAMVSDLHVRQRHDGKVTLSIHTAVERFSDGDIRVKARLTDPNGRVFEQAGAISVGSTESSLEIVVEDPRMWWPNGYGAQPLYGLTVDVVSASDGSLIDRKSIRLGLRKIEILQKQDQWGKSFAFVVNDVPVFCKGANWIPADQFPARLTREHYRTLISDAAAVHMNMLRVWGGGFYEDDRFYDLCDEYGIMIWQDFMFSCAHHPVHPEMLEEVRLEAIDNVHRIRHHACLALWCGNNEIEWGIAAWWKDRDRERMCSEYGTIYNTILPEVCAAEDPDTFYWRSSPCSADVFEDPNSTREGDCHCWITMEMKPAKAFREYTPRFASEFGFQALPPMDTIATFAGPDDLNLSSYVMDAHQKHSVGNGLPMFYLVRHFRLPGDFAMMVYVSQVLQGEIVRTAVEHWRRHRNQNRCMGALYWQLNDCWPVISWSSIDYNFRWKALHYFARRFYAPVLLSAEETGYKVSLHVTNDRMQPFKGVARWSLERLDGTQLDSGEVKAEVPEGTNSLIAELDFTDRLDIDSSRSTVLVYELLSGEESVSLAVLPFVPDKHLDLPRVRISADVDEENGRVSITLNSAHTARHVSLEVPGHNVRFSDNFFDLPAGRPVMVEAEHDGGLSAAEIASRLRVVSLADSY